MKLYFEKLKIIVKANFIPVVIIFLIYVIIRGCFYATIF